VGGASINYLNLPEVLCIWPTIEIDPNNDKL
jgi:hypothetical protein